MSATVTWRLKNTYFTGVTSIASSLLLATYLYSLYVTQAGSDGWTQNLYAI